jgi:hypothetical protein
MDCAFFKIRNAAGFGYPNYAVMINLAPANVRKEGAGFDLPMAIGILGAMGTFGGLDHHLLVANCRWMVRSGRSEELCPWRCAHATRVSGAWCRRSKTRRKQQW